MKKLLLIISGAAILLAGCQKTGKISTAALATLADYEYSVYELTSIDWSEQPVSRTRNTVICGTELLMQLSTLQEYNNFSDRYNTLTIGRAEYNDYDNSFNGGIDLWFILQQYNTARNYEWNDIPSKVTYDFFSFSSYCLRFSYSIDKKGVFSYTDTYTAPKQDNLESMPHNELQYMNCKIIELSKERVVIEFPKYAVPDFRTDTFITGSITATYSRR